MSSESIRHCPMCATAIPLNFPEGMCPRCLLAGSAPVVEGEETLPYEGGLPSESGSRREFRPGVPSVETLRGLFPDLEILELVGAGGMGAVYKARQPRLDRLVALKVMLGAPGREKDFALRFEREAQVLARLSHPHIVTLHDFGEFTAERTGDVALFWFLMEYVDGTDLCQLIRSKELKATEALAIVPQICKALQYAHDQGITHRDIKPANILIDQRGVVKIADFGLAKMAGGVVEEAMMTGLTQTGWSMGTPHYMAPEQWEHPELVDHRADIYALGVVFYEMLTGERPAGVFEPPSRKSSPPVDKKLDGVVMRAMEQNPARRYQQAGQIGDDVTRISGANKRKPASPSASQAPHGPLKPLLALVAAVALVAGGWSLWPEAKAKKGSIALPPAVALTQEWVKVDFASVDPALSDPDMKLHEGRLHIPNGGWRPLPSKNFRQVAQRVSFTWPGELEGIKLLFSSTAQSTNQAEYYAKVGTAQTGGQYWSIGRHQEIDLAITSSDLFVKPELKPGDAVVFQFAVLGETLYTWLNGRLLGAVRQPDRTLADGCELKVSANDLTIDSFEYLPLDNLSEADALTVLGVEGTVPLISSAFDSASGPSAVSSPRGAPGGASVRSGRLRATGAMAAGGPHDLAGVAAYDDFVDVAGGWGRWVALRTNGDTISSDGRADFKGIAKIASSFNAEYAFITTDGKLVIPDYREWKVPSALERGVMDAALGFEHGIAWLEGGRAVAFGARYETAVGDPADPQQYGTPRWPAPEAGALEKVMSVAATVTHAATLHEDGTLSIWGWEGPMKWEPDPRQKSLRRLRSTEDGIWALDEAGQLWRLSVPRNPSPDQPVYVTGKPVLIAAGVTGMGERCWLRSDGAWASDMGSIGADLLNGARITPQSAFSLNGGIFDGRPFSSLLWIERKPSATPEDGR